MGTNLQDIFDSFYLKIPREDATPSYVFALIKPALAKVYKQFSHNIKFIVTDSEEFEGYFVDELYLDEVELLTLQMAIDYHTAKDLDRLLTLQSLIGTKDFNKLPTYKDNLVIVKDKISALKLQLEELKSDMNKYSK